METSSQDSALDAAQRPALVDDIADLEVYAFRGEQPPRCSGYRIRVNRKLLVIHNAEPTGREILTEAGFCPPKDYTLRLKRRSGRPKKIALDETVDLTEKGVEKFKVLPRDQTEG